MNSECQSFEELLSAHLDGEAAPEAAVAALEHALRCPSCRAFYEGSRRLEREIAARSSAGTGGDAADDSASVVPAAERVWGEIRRASGWTREVAGPERKPGRRRIPQGWVFAAAAGLAAAVGLSLWLALDRPGGAPGEAATRALREVAAASVAESAPTGSIRMTDERFVAITRELLGADPRYLRAMEGVLREVVPVGEGSGGEDLPVRGERVGLMPLRGPV